MLNESPGVPLRSAVITGTAFFSGSGVGMVVDGVAAKLGFAHLGVGQLVTGILVLWVAEKLDRLIAHTEVTRTCDLCSAPCLRPASRELPTT